MDMKKWINGLAALLAGAALLTACSDDEGVVTEQIPALNASTLVPNATGSAGESGKTRAYVGTVVTAEGFNLDHVSRVTFTPTAEGAEEIVAEIVEQTIKTLKFKVPTLDFGQRDDSYAANLRVYGDGDAAIFQYLYYVTVPVTDAIVTGYAPATGTVGTEITISGRNLEQVTEVRFDNHTILSDAFVNVVEGSTTSSVTFVVPVGTYAAGENDIAIEAVWGGSNRIDVTGENPFKMQIAKVEELEPQPEGTSAKIGDELTLTGEFLDLVTNVYWGTYELLITEQSAEQIVVKFPSSIGQAEVRAVAVAAADEAVVEADITALYSGFTEPVVLCAGYRVDTTPIGPAKPVFASWTAEDGGDDNKFYLGKTVTVKGENLASIEGFTVDGVAAELSGTPTDVEAKFIVPAGVTFTEATEVAVKALYNGGEAVDFGQATVYPFYFYPDVTIGAQDASNADMAFFLPTMGKVIPTSEWSSVDKYAATNAMTGALVLNKNVISKEQYYEVPPYFFSTYTGNVLTLQSPANSSGQIKNFKADGTSITGNTSVYGVPLICFKVLKSSTSSEKKFIDAVIDGSIETLENTMKASTGAPKYSTDFNEEDVVLVQYATYEFGTKGPDPTQGQVCSAGFIHIKSVTGSESSKGTITFDCYWSKTLNE